MKVLIQNMTQKRYGKLRTTLDIKDKSSSVSEIFHDGRKIIDSKEISDCMNVNLNI